MKKKHFKKTINKPAVDVLCGANVPCVDAEISIHADARCNGICW